ncbi:hypothetical protein WR25_23774 [Diploscapter pachys]|uniref:Uncharacterized protein n=1 Tax=Diploscapter pachys TaxID=2018661 RepID=A0A2A2KTW7_9BILA|nr:hypothetical protein WR25_23774 [Diploscapter pachys]
MPDMDLPPVETTTELATYGFSKFYLFTMSVEWAYNSIWSRYRYDNHNDYIQSIDIYKHDHINVHKYDHINTHKHDHINDHINVHKYDHIDIYKYDHIDMLNLDCYASSM